jgi:hypothetical protein
MPNFDGPASGICCGIRGTLSPGEKVGLRLFLCHRPKWCGPGQLPFADRASANESFEEQHRPLDRWAACSVVWKELNAQAQNQLLNLSIHQRKRGRKVTA